MNRIDEKFKELRKEKKTAFIPYITAGDPDISTTKKIVSALAASGADIIELGIPFSDPLADGPTIQQAMQRSLGAGCTVRKVMRMAKELRAKIQTPFVFMTYYNIVFNYGPEAFIHDAKKCGADGLIVPDLPMEESRQLTEIADRAGFNVIMLTAPTTPPARFKLIAGCSRGFIYHVSLTGVTGARSALSSRLKKDVRKLKKLTKKPVCVGFGISTPAQAADISGAADGIIIGSAIIKIIEKHLRNKKAMLKGISGFARSIAKAVHKG